MTSIKGSHAAYIPIGFVVFSIIVSACITSPSPTATSLPALQVRALSKESCSTVVPEPPSMANLAKRPEGLLGGGTVPSGDFFFDLWLYCDKELSPESSIPSQYSDIAGLGIHYSWLYNGPGIEGKVEELRGFEDDIKYFSGFDGGISIGSMGSYTGGIHFPDRVFPISSEDPIRFYLEVRTSQGTFGAMISFVLEQGPNGLDLSNMQVEPLLLEK